MHLYPDQDTWAWWLNVWTQNPQEPKRWIGMWGWESEYTGMYKHAKPVRPSTQIRSQLKEQVIDARTIR